MHLAQQKYPEVSTGLYNVYLGAIQRPHAYLILDLTQDTNAVLLFRTYIFPKEYPPVVYSDIGYEACEFELSRPSLAEDR